ncbi:MAG TPA: hypothetical protein VEI82_14690 [Myxococcota bacterium]|nr:hypothetical protein [Myxococcota bacterium]
MKRQLLLLACVSAAVSNRAFAASLSVNGWTLGEQVTIAAGADTGTVNTAQLDLTLNGVSGFGYCVDLAQSIGPGTTSGWQALSPDSIVRAAWLVDTFQPQLGSMIHPAGGEYSFGVSRQTAIAALQVAVWEVMSDSPGSYDVYSGSFALASGGASDGVANLARQFLGELSMADLSGFQTGDLWAQNGRYQDQLFVGTTNPIPEAGTITLYLIGAALGAHALRRRA